MMLMVWFAMQVDILNITHPVFVNQCLELNSRHVKVKIDVETQIPCSSIEKKETNVEDMKIVKL